MKSARHISSLIILQIKLWWIGGLHNGLFWPWCDQSLIWPLQIQAAEDTGDTEILAGQDWDSRCTEAFFIMERSVDLFTMCQYPIIDYFNFYRHLREYGSWNTNDWKDTVDFYRRMKPTCFLSTVFLHRADIRHTVRSVHVYLRCCLLHLEHYAG